MGNPVRREPRAPRKPSDLTDVEDIADHCRASYWTVGTGSRAASSRSCVYPVASSHPAPDLEGFLETAGADERHGQRAGRARLASRPVVSSSTATRRSRLAARRAGWRRRIANFHRQAGKDQAGLVDVVEAAVTQPGTYAYIAPTQAMADRIAWHGVRASDGLPYLSIIPPRLVLDRNEADMRLTLATVEPGKFSVILFLSGDRPDRLRGLPLGVRWSPSTPVRGAGGVRRDPARAEPLGGWGAVLSTPLGLNHFHQLWTMAQDSSGLVVRDADDPRTA